MGHDPYPIDLLLSEHSDFVERLAQKLLADRGAAEDLSQEAWRVVLERRPRAIADFRAWVTGLVRNLARMHVRSESARRRREHHAVVAPVADRQGDAVDRLDELDRLVQALRRLREPFRTAVLLRYREGLAPRAIARQTGVPVDTVKSRLKRGLALLRDDLKATRGDDERAWRSGLALLLLRRTGRQLQRVTVWGASAALALLTAVGVWLGLSAATREAPAPAESALLPENATAVPDPSGTAIVRLPLPAEHAAAEGASDRALRIVDATTGEAVPGFVVAAPDLDPPLLVTDGDGVLRFAARGGALELRLIDDARLRPERPIEAELAGSELRVQVGPTYRLDLTPPPGEADRFDARLAALEPRLQHRTSFAPVRIGDTPWVRFAADASHLGGGPPWRLEVRSDDGYRLGWAAVGSAAGVHRDLVAIELAPQGRVEGRVAEPDGRPIDQAEVVLEGEGRGFAGVTDADGAFDLPWIRPGAYTLRARSRRHVPAETAVVVRERATTEATLELRPLPDEGVVRGVLKSDAGRLAPPLNGPVAVVLTHCDDPDLTFVQTVECAARPADGALAAFRFDGVPAGAYELAVRAPDFCRWQPASLRVTPGQRGIELRRRDAEPLADLELRAVDAGTGAVIERFDAFVRLDGDDRTGKVLAAQDGRVRLHNVPLDAALEWTLRAPDHASESGGREALAAAVRLEGGWGNTLCCVDRDARPVAGVELAVDGVPAGSTGADGRLRLRRAARPARIAIAPGRFVATGGDLLPDGRFSDLIWGITVTVEMPAPREPESPSEERR